MEESKAYEAEEKKINLEVRSNINDILRNNRILD